MDSTQRDDQDPAAVAPSELSGKGATRRRLGLGASGLIMTLASKPGMATNPMYCGTVSGWHSASTASRVRTDGGSCAGLSHGYWKNHPWPGGTNRRALFSSIFPEGKGSRYTDSALYTVLINNDPSFDPCNLRQELVTAYLNAMAGYNTHPNVRELKAIWAAYAPSGTYKVVSTGEILLTQGLKNYLAASHDGV